MPTKARTKTKANFGVGTKANFGGGELEATITYLGVTIEDMAENIPVSVPYVVRIISTFIVGATSKEEAVEEAYSRYYEFKHDTEEEVMAVQGAGGRYALC